MGRVGAVVQKSGGRRVALDQKVRSTFWKALVSAAATFFATAVHADVGDRFGFGSRDSALGGSYVAGAWEGYAAYANPAALSLQGDLSEAQGPGDTRRLNISYGLILMVPSIKPISGVVTANAQTSDVSTPTSGSVDTDYKSTFGQALGVSYHLLPDIGNLTVGVVAYLPVSQLAYFDTGDAYQPEYLLYRADTQRPEIELGAGAEIYPGLRVGAGLHIAYSLTGTADFYIQSDPTHASSARISDSLSPKAAPYFGALWAPRGNADDFSIAAVVRLPVTSDGTLSVTNGAQLFGNLAALDYNLMALTSLYYDPLTLELGTAIRHSGIAKLYAQLDYEFWSKYQAPALAIQTTNVTSCPNDGNCGVTVVPSNNPQPQYRNILIPHVGEEIEISEATVVRAGYSFRPSMIEGEPIGAGNYLDPPTHEISAGLGFKFSHFLGYAAPCALDLHLAYDLLVSSHITKSDPTDIGAPGYDVGGNMIGGGTSVSLAF